MNTMLKKPDEYYVKQIQAGKLQLYAQLVNRHKSFVYNLAFRLVQNKEEAEEVAQDAFVKAYHALATFKQQAKFNTWLYRIVYNTAISRLRNKPMHTVELNETISQQDELLAADGFASLKAKEQKELVEKALNLLPPEDKTLLLLFYWEACTVGDIAEIMQLSVSNTKVRLMRARKKMYVILEKQLKNELTDML